MGKNNIYMILRRVTILLPFYLFIVLPLSAQYEKLGGVYYAYPVTETTLVDVPEGYEPFYISHYGRHGSRWLPNDKRYTWVKKQFEDKNRLTKLGKSVRKRMEKIWKNAQGNGGLLTPLGGRQHHQIARRMYQNFPQLFTADAHIMAHSSTVNRCKTSMENFVAELKTQNPSIKIDPLTRQEDMAWIAYKSKEQSYLEHSWDWPLPISTDRFINALFTDASHLSKANREKLLSELHTIASDMQDVELDVSLYDIFTEEELVAVYNLNNRRMTRHNGDEIMNNGIAARCATSLWNRIEADADAAIARKDVGADLRFGHDTNLYRLMTLMGINLRGERSEVRGERYDRMDEILPMAANLQMIFYRGKKEEGRGKKVLVQLLLNEHPVTISNLSPLTIPEQSSPTRSLSHLSPLTSKLEHLGWPLNSQGDDFGMTFEGKRNQGYFCSSRGDLRGNDHIYSFYNPEIVQTVKGWVYEQDGYELPAAQVYMVGNDGTNLRLSVRGDGSFTQEVKPGVDYVLLATCKGYLNHQQELRV